MMQSVSAKNFPSTLTEMTINREELIADYAQQILDGMDMKTVECFVYDTLRDNLSSYSDEELIAEVTEYNPELLEDVTV